MKGASTVSRQFVYDVLGYTTAIARVRPSLYLKAMYETEYAERLRPLQ